MHTRSRCSHRLSCDGRCRAGDGGGEGQFYDNGGKFCCGGCDEEGRIIDFCGRCCFFPRSMSLKERIAALQHREDAGSPAAAAAAPAGHGGPNTTALRAKIAQFESKGAVPAPRGSFGMGAPPESGPPRRAELYGNRMRPSPAAVLERRDISPFAALEDDALPKDMRALTPQHTGPEHKPTVVARGTAFNTALDIARKAEADVQSHAEKREKRRSGAWLTPQFTGGSALVPQYTGGSFTSSALTPQHTGSSALMPHYTGSNPSSPPLSPLVPYSHSWSPRSPTFRETLPKSPTMPVTEEPEEQSLTLTEEPEEQPLTLTDVDSIEPVADNWKGPEPSALPSSPLEEVIESPKVQEEFDEEETGPSVDEVVAESIQDDVLDQRIHDVPSDVVVVPPTSPSTPDPTPNPAQDPRNLNSEDIPAEPELEPDSPDSFHAGFEPDSPDSFHAGFDPQQYVLYPASASSTPLSYSYDLNMSTTYAARNRHLSTITERSAEPGSPGWDAEASRRYSMMSVQAQVLDEYDELEAEAGGGQSTPRGEEETELEEPAGPGRAGVGAGWGGRSVEFGAGMGTGARVLGGVVEERDEEEARAPSPSPYRLSGLTERGYTPSLRSEGSVGSFRELSGDSEGERDGDGDEAEEGGEGGELEEEEPPTPMANAQASLTSEPVETEAAPPTTTAHPQTGHNRDLLLPPQQDGDNSLSSSQRDSLLSLSPSQRDSLFSSQRDSLSSLSSQTLRVRPRPLSALSALDSGSPSHVALAHRIPVFDAIGAVGVAGAEQVFVSAGSGLTPTRDAPPTPPTPTPVPPEAATPIRRALSAGATAPSSRALPTPPAPPPATSLPTTPHQAAAQAPPDAPRTPPRRHGYTTGAPRPHTTYVPPAPDPEDELYRGVGEFGTISFGGGVPHSFSAVVHGRVREGSASSGGRGRSGSSPDAGGGGEYEKDKRLPLPPMPMSPGYASAELAELLAEAAALEVRLERGELPGEALRRMSMRPPPPSSEPQAPMPPLPPVPEAAKSGAKALKPQRSFRNPLARSRSDRRPEQKTEVRPAAASSSSGNLLNLRIQNPGPPEAEDVQLSRPMGSPTSSIPPTPPPKSPGYGGGTRYFSSLRRLASTTRTLGLAGTDGRGSLSTSSELSSEDSMLVTPPDDGAMSVGHNVVWPTISPKKSAGSIGRSAASLAGRVFNRSRTKSSTSTASSFDAPSPPPMPHPALPSPPSLKLDSTPFFIPAIQTSLHEEDHVESPATSTPVADPYTSPTTAKPKSATPPTRPPHLVLNQPAPGGESLLKASNVSPTHESRPSSMMSNISSVTSSSAAQSPLFDNAIFDAFPSVPQMTPPNVSGHLRAGPLSAGTTRGGVSGELLGRLAETHQRVDALL